MTFTLWIPPAQYPTWHERAYDPGTPEQMYYLLGDESRGCNGEFGHHYWGEHHPYYTRQMRGYVWLPGIRMHEVPRHMRQDCVLDYRDGRVFLKAIVDETVVPSWV